MPEQAEHLVDKVTQIRRDAVERLGHTPPWVWIAIGATVALIAVIITAWALTSRGRD